MKVYDLNDNMFSGSRTHAFHILVSIHLKYYKAVCAKYNDVDERSAKRRKHAKKNAFSQQQQQQQNINEKKRIKKQQQRGREHWSRLSRKTQRRKEKKDNLLS